MFQLSRKIDENNITFLELQLHIPAIGKFNNDNTDLAYNREYYTALCDVQFLFTL